MPCVPIGIIKGKKGDTGLKGDKGDKGDVGAAGNDGVSVTKTEINQRGELVITLSDNTVSNLGVVVGAKGDKGDKGDTGKSAYELYCEAYPDYEGTLEEWLASLKGETGQNGKDGTNGKDGKGISNIASSADGYLIITYTDGTTDKIAVEFGTPEESGVLIYSLLPDGTYGVMAGHRENLHNFCPVCGDKTNQTEEEGANHQWAGVSYFL